MQEDPRPSPPVLGYAKAEPKPVGYLTHKQQYLIMFAIAGMIAVKEVVSPQFLHVGDAIVFACIPVCLAIGNHHLREHRKRMAQPTKAESTKDPPPP